ncbi:MAG: tetratricopeptide repeat protein [Spirochaetales bacterium]|nr:tetratricopeptide repeat protein [Spirochaetales bacterium]
MKKILYINLPESLAEQIDEFTLDSSIPLPVEIPEGQEDSWDIGQLNWPALISGMLYVLQEKPNGRDSDYYRSLLKAVRPDIVNTVLTTAQLKVDQEQFSFAEELFKTLCALEPEVSLHRSNLALFYKKRDEYRLKDNPEYSRALHEIKEKNWDKGIALIESFLGNHSDSSNGWFLLGWALRQTEKWAQAFQAFQRAGEVAPPTAELLNEMSLCESEQGNWNRALEHLEEGLKLEEDNPTLLSNMAMVCLKMNDLSRADQILNRLKEIDPDDPMVQHFLG